jgi:hypothetical protein
VVVGEVVIVIVPVWVYEIPPGNVLVGDGPGVSVLVGVVGVYVPVGVRVFVGVRVLVGIRVFVGVSDGVIGVGVRVGAVPTSLHRENSEVLLNPSVAVPIKKSPSDTVPDNQILKEAFPEPLVLSVSSPK